MLGSELTICHSICSMQITRRPLLYQILGSFSSILHQVLFVFLFYSFSFHSWNLQFHSYAELLYLKILFPNFEVVEFRWLGEQANKSRELNRELTGRNLNCREIVNTFLFYRDVRRARRKNDKVKITMNVELQWRNVYMLLQ